MSFPTPKFELKQAVYAVQKATQTEWKDCTFCNSTGILTGQDGSCVVCPRCYGKLGETKFKELKWIVNQIPMHIGQIRVEYTDKPWCMNLQPAPVQIQYMCAETGVRGGTLWSEDRLFATYEEAKDAAELLNVFGDGA